MEFKKKKASELEDKEIYWGIWTIEEDWPPEPIRFSMRGYFGNKPGWFTIGSEVPYPFSEWLIGDPIIFPEDSDD